MAAQAPSRRQLLQALACASVASTAPGFSRWAFAFAEPELEQTHHNTAPHPAAHTQPYSPRFFTPAEYRDIVLLAELILPHTPSPRTPGPRTPGAATPPRPGDAGATDAGVAEFIDFIAAHDPALQPVFRQGLAWMDSAAAPHTFATLPAADQTALLTRLAYKKDFRPDEAEGQQFFSTMRRYTVMGFYTTRIGLEALDYPGLRFYSTSPSVPSDGSLERLGVRA